MSVKQIILVRKDIKLPKGKLGAQTAHASLGVVKKLILADKLNPHKIETEWKVARWWNNLAANSDNPPHLPGNYIAEWWTGSWTKVCLALDKLDDLDPLLDKCTEAGLIYDIVTDNGLTIYHGVPTITCIGIEPSSAEILDPIFQQLKLY